MTRLLSKKGLEAIYAVRFFVRIVEFLQEHLPNSRITATHRLTRFNYLYDIIRFRRLKNIWEWGRI